jgi:hypothetical protein
VDLFVHQLVEECRALTRSASGETALDAEELEDYARSTLETLEELEGEAAAMKPYVRTKDMLRSQGLDPDSHEDSCVYCRYIRSRRTPRYNAPLIVVGFVEAMRPGASIDAFRAWLEYAAVTNGQL